MYLRCKRTDGWKAFCIMSHHMTRKLVPIGSTLQRLMTSTDCRCSWAREGVRFLVTFDRLIFVQCKLEEADDGHVSSGGKWGRVISTQWACRPLCRVRSRAQTTMRTVRCNGCSCDELPSRSSMRMRAARAREFLVVGWEPRYGRVPVPASSNTYIQMCIGEETNSDHVRFGGTQSVSSLGTV